jgi:SAM-dependent methyltransferase
MSTIHWGPEIASVYDSTYAHMFSPTVLDPMTGLLAALAGDGPALEFATGTGRVALALAARGVPVHGIELSEHMTARMAAKPGAGAIPVTIGNMAADRVPGGPFSLVYLVANTLMNVTTQDEQVAVFANAADHLEPGGCFVLELAVPRVRPEPAVFTLDPDHIGIETYDDPVAQIAWSHHWMGPGVEAGGPVVRHSAPYRYVWPSELDLMARLAGFRLSARWGGWDKSPFTAASGRQVASYEKLP